MYYVKYSTMNDTYTKSFRDEEDALGFCEMIRKLYPGQEPEMWTNN